MARRMWNGAIVRSFADSPSACLTPGAEDGLPLENPVGLVGVRLGPKIADKGYSRFRGSASVQLGSSL